MGRNKKHHKEYMVGYYEENKKRIKEKQATYRQENKQKRNTYNKQWRDNLVLTALMYYSGGKMECVCCREKEVKFLTIDHINNDGGAHRKKLGYGGNRFYYWLKKNNYPEGYVVACFNCNCGRARNGGICPHKEGTMGKRKLVYVSSPFGAKRENQERAAEYAKYVMEQGHVPFVPHLLFPWFLDDKIPEQRTEGLRMCVEMLERCDELWAFGPKESSGMEMERISWQSRFPERPYKSFIQ